MASAKLSRELGQDTMEKGAVLPRPQQVLGRKQVRGNMAAAFYPATPTAAGPEAGKESSPSLPDWHQVQAGQLR